MKSPCPQCAAASVWTHLINVRRERGVMVMAWECGFCQHTWVVPSARTAPHKASPTPKARRRRRA